MKTYKFLSILIIFILFQTSCSKDELQENENSSQTEISPKSIYGVTSTFIDNGFTASLTCPNNMLILQDSDHYNDVLDMLEQLVEDHEDAFVNAYAHLNEDDLNDLEESLGFESHLPLIQFENALEFCSLRKKIRREQDDWLNTQTGSEMDFTNDPDEHFIFENEERTLLNEQAEVIVGRLIYKFYEDGYVTIDVTDPNAPQILTDLNNGANPQSIAADNNSTNYFPDGTNPNCIFKDEGSKKILIADRQIKMKYKIKQGPFNFKVLSKTVSYKKKGSKWKRRRARIAAGFRGEIKILGQTDCEVKEPFNRSSRIKKKRERKYAERIRKGLINSIFEARAYIPGDLSSWHYIVGNEHTEMLPY